MAEFMEVTQNVTLPIINTAVLTDSSNHYSHKHHSDPLLMEFNLENSYAKVFNIPHSNDLILTETPINNPPFSFKKEVIQQIQQLTNFWQHLRTDKDYEQVLFYFFHSAMSNTVYKVSLYDQSNPSAKKQPQGQEPHSFIIRIYGTGMDASYSSILKSYQEHEQQTSSHLRKDDSLSRNTSNQSFKSIASSTDLVDIGSPMTPSADLSPHPSSSSPQAPISPFAESSTKLHLSPYLGHSLESLWMCLLSEERVSPCVYGQFGNGRIEETILDSFPLSAETLRYPNISPEIAKQLGILHASTDSLRKLAVKLYRECHIPYRQLNEIMNCDLHYWKVITNSFHKIKYRLPIYPSFQYTALVSMLSHIERLLTYVPPKQHVFCHSDLQYGNIMSSDLDPSVSQPTILLIDYEYGCFGPRGFDIANHFFEWMCNYQIAPSHVIYPEHYPSEQQCHTFLAAYLLACLSSNSHNGSHRESNSKKSLRVPPPADNLSEVVNQFLSTHWAEIRFELQFFTLISDLKWAFWGIVQHVQRTKDTEATLKLATNTTPTTSEVLLSEPPSLTEDPHQFYLDYAFMRIEHFWELSQRVIPTLEIEGEGKVGQRTDLTFPISNMLIWKEYYNN